MSEIKNPGGRPPGIPREGKYGLGVKTKLVRVPVELAPKIPLILSSHESIKMAIVDWELRIQESAKKSKHGIPSPRYEKAIELLQELRTYLPN